MPGDEQMDDELFSLSAILREDSTRVWRFLREGGRRNAINLLQFLQARFFSPSDSEAKAWEEPRVLPHTLIYDPHQSEITFHEWQQQRVLDQSTALLLFYRSHFMAGNTDAFDQLIDILKQNALNVLPLATESLKNPDCLAIVNQLSVQAQCTVIINTTSFAMGSIETSAAISSQEQRPFLCDVPVIQAILASNSTEDWQQSNQGLRARDIAMNIALPEFDGRIISRAISFKEFSQRSERTQIDVIRYRLHVERAHFVSQLAKKWSVLSVKKNHEKRIALILSNYPTKDGRIGNGVGLDTPASTVNILNALKQNQYPAENIPPVEIP